jgi:small ligand-binding sensory domain FIST
MEPMNIHTALSRSDITADAVDSVCREVATKLGDRPVDLAFVFFSSHHTGSADFLASIIQERLHPRVLLGCSAESIIEGKQEIEGQPALCLWAAHLPGANLVPFHLRFEQQENGFTATGWPAEMPSPESQPSILVIGEPFTTPVEALLGQLHERYPKAPAIGGMASGAHQPGGNRLIFNGEAVEDGAVGLVLTGAVRIRTVVSQGCRPIGERFMITHAEQNVVHELSGKPALERLREVFSLLSPTEQQQAERALHLGIVIDEHKDHFERGDFLIRNLVGADQQTGSFAVGDIVKEGQTVQFQLRDAAAASEDLHALLTGQRTTQREAPPAGALVFSCNGRGQRFFQTPHHDAGAIRDEMGSLPVGGFFAMGEIGPVGGSNFLHSYTASIALFVPADPSPPT